MICWTTERCGGFRVRSGRATYALRQVKSGVPATEVCKRMRELAAQ